MQKVLLIFFLGLIAQCAWGQSDSTDSKTDSLQINLPDSAAIINSTKKLIADSLSNEIDLPSTVKLDSTLDEQAKEAAKSKIEEHLNVDIPSDSLAIKQKLDKEASKALKEEAGFQINGIPTDSTEIKNAAIKNLEQELGTTIPKDSAAVKNELSNRAKDEFKNQTGLDAPDITLDSTTVDQVKEEATNRGEEYLKNTDEYQEISGDESELGNLMDAKEELELKKQELEQLKARQELKQKMTSQTKEFIQQNAEQIQQVQSKMGELKKKYSSVVNSNDLSTATKRSSLKGESIWKRLVLGGNLNISETNPLKIDFSPVLGWKFNKLFEAGVTGAYRAKFGASRNGFNAYKDEQVYGYSVFVNHMVFKNFFGYLEGENMSTVSGTAENNSRTWKQSLLLGIGRKFKVAKFLEMQAIVSYNFLHDNADGVYNSPVVFKTGFRVVK